MARTERRIPLWQRILGGAGGILGILIGLGLLIYAVFAQFQTQSKVHPLFRPAALYSSVDPVAQLTDPSRDYAITSLNSRLETCTISSLSGPLRLTPDRDTYFTDRSVFRFSVPHGSYEINCEPDVWFEVYKGADVEVAVRGYVGPVHPTVYYLVGAALFFFIGFRLWSRFIQRPRDWSNTTEW